MTKITRNGLFWLVLAAISMTAGSASGADPAPLPFVSPIFGDKMVLQRGKPNAIWGWSQAGDSVRVEIGENSATATAGADGKWQARVQPPALGGPYTLKIAGGRQTVELFVRGPSVTPQWAAGVVAEPARNNNSGSIPLTINKLRNLNQKGSFSSQRPGHEAAYAVDDANGTWWEPAENDGQPSITLDLGPGTEWNPAQEFTVDSLRIEFVARGGFGRGAAAPAMSGPAAHQYRIETSRDGKSFATVGPAGHGQSHEAAASGNSPLGIMEFTVFGKPLEQTR